MELVKQYYYRKKIKKKNISSKKVTTMMTMHFPKDVMVEILSKLPANSLLRLRWLCKYWFNIITDPYFVKMQLNNVHATNNPLIFITSPVQRCPQGSIKFCSLNPIDDDVNPVHIKAPILFTSSRAVFKILGSCNGLLCIGLFTSYCHKIFIWNPCTKLYKVLIRRPVTAVPEENISYGFGYDCIVDDYKVVRNVCSWNGETLVDLFTLGANSWKKLSNNRFYFYSDAPGLFINGDLYWKARLTCTVPGSEPFNIIVAFNVAKEEYRQMPKRISKPYINYHESNHMNLGNFKGCLCVLNVAADRSSMDLWVMNHNIDDLKDEYSWDILYTISAPPRYSLFSKPLQFCKNGEIAMARIKISNMYGAESADLILYDPKYNKFRSFPKSDMLSVETYIESLVPIKGGTFIDETPSIATGKRKRNVKKPLRFQDEYNVC